MDKWVVKSLLKPQAYPEQTGSVQLIQTHISYVFITDRFVYKVKKPVDFGFLNFSTMDRRRFYCDEEVRLNSRLSPEIYLGVVELRESASGPGFGGDGKIIDYAVKMKRLPEERMLHRLLQRGQVNDHDMRSIARKIGEFHLSAARSPEIDGYGSMESIRHNWEENFQQLEGFLGITVTRSELEIIRDWFEGFTSRNSALFERRIAKGFIRECDGDIHLENICLTEKVVIFDCIEFNQRFSCSDTAADISFLLMDLEYHARGDLSGVLLDEYLAVTGDVDLPLLTDFYKIYRAVVRGKVESLLTRDPEVAPERQREAQEKARSYFRLARGYILRRNMPPTLLITCGLMGSGKSTIARALAIELGMDTVSSDLVRKRIAAVTPQPSGTMEYGAGIYAAPINSATYGELLKEAEKAISDRRSIVVDATFRRKNDRASFERLAAEYRCPFFIIWTEAPEKAVEQRLKERARDPEAISDGRWEHFSRQREEMEAPSEEEGSIIMVDTSGPLTDTVDRIINGMGLLTCGRT